jgi:hypothetical protein
METTENRRQHIRVVGPFDGRRVGALDLPVRIYDISEGGCFVHSMHEQKTGVRLLLDIELPYEGWIRVKAEVLYQKPEFGYAVRFTDFIDEAHPNLCRCLQRLQDRQPYEP